MTAATVTLIILVLAAICFVTEIIPLAVTAMGVAVLLAVTNVLTAKEALAGLSDLNVVIFAGMFVVGAAIFQTGLAKRIGDSVVKATGKGELRLIIGVMLIAAILSSLLSNTGTTAVLLPVTIGIARSAGISKTRCLLPLALAAGLGGIMTLVGTPPNLVVNGVLDSGDFRPFSFFEYAFIGIPLTIAGIIYIVTIGKKLLPNRTDDESINHVEKEEKVFRTNKQWIAGAVLLVVVVMMAFEKKVGVPLAITAVAGALIMILTGCLTEREAYDSIDWTTIFLFAGMLPLAAAMEKTGAGSLIANTVIGMMGTSPSPYILVIVMFLLTSGLTQFMSNTASSALLAPIGVAIAQGLGASPHAVLMTIAAAASTAFATPVGTPPNTLVLGPGGYPFVDYMKIGFPLILVCFLISIVLIPLIWPFYP
ncbi:MAG: SLC13 family permease [Desulfitobacteriaceae bacterium]|nr:SLC13 family permease [Desulfitobacteriaceae bacterium]